jgi:hypothetical protein
MKIRLFLANLLFWIHVATVVFWAGLFLVPTSLWHDRITFHFYLTIVIVGHQFLWGLMIMPWTHKFRMVCIITTFVQLLRNQKISDPKNYSHSFFKEMVGKRGIQAPHWASTTLTFSILGLITLQFIFLR